MKAIFALALVTCQFIIVKPESALSTRSPRCEVNLGDPLSGDTIFFNQFLSVARCVKKDYLGKKEMASPYSERIPDIPSESIDSKLVEKFPFIVGPETIEVLESEDVAYTGADDGYIYEIDLIGWNATKLTTACSASGVTQCRPQGIRVTSDNKMYFADLAGLCVYDFSTAEVTVLVPRLSVVENLTVMLPNDLDVDEGTQIVYMSDGSTNYANTDILRGTLLHENSGRVLAYDIKTGEVSVLVSSLSFPNGIQLSHDKKTLLVNEMNKRRILQVTLAEASKGEYKVFTPALPGEPDNIRAASNGNYWVAINLARNGSQKVFYDYIANDKCATERYIKMNDFVVEYLRLVGKTTQREDYDRVADRLGSYQFISEMASHQGSFVLVDGSGKVTKRYTSEKTGFFSNPTEYKNMLLIGNDRHPNIAIVQGIL
ncbi:adipocyte plasma membrane-associated protein-like [Tropilaelaps mercedesae]|uniref:Adipocyte plasma membrane-associated protein-like n=1 Tax=Tropilaelaps mercedesae TaxID=418985 RepID=A0A1V9XNX2_9ACAR|nr:adipocyte plasma membrane-associated protein-like [Tropilaelaps mercedesae]